MALLARTTRARGLGAGWASRLLSRTAVSTVKPGDTTLLRVLSRTVAKNQAGRERRAGRVPALIYGLSQHNIPISVNAIELRPYFRRNDFYNRVLELELPDGAGVIRALPRELEVDFETMQPNYVTFLRWPEDLEKNPQMVPVPVQVINEDLSPGVKAGHFCYKIFKTWRFKVFKEPIISSIVVDAGPLNLGNGIKLSSLVIPEGHVSIPQGQLIDPTLVKVIKSGN
ncbi:ribosomal protein L25/Gln-tRNA synthetase [Pavlovales sp. CCMP2436]|nr:ribosomal protein L25/Gln-tRNA synthetase [Pavlovales sp. CCMP2436]